MNEYIFYTSEGHTEAPHESVEVENCQVMGRAKGRNAKEALKNLLRENSWIYAAGFNPYEFFSAQLLPEHQRLDI